MRSARRKKIIENKKKKSRLLGLILKFILPLVILAGLALYIKVNTRYWNGEDKFEFTFRKEDESIGVTILDPKLNDMTTITIPGDTEVEVSRNYGTLRIKNVWQLGINEKLSGQLLAETVTQSFLFPVFLWSDSDIEGLVTRSRIINLMKFVLFPKKTNIPLGDRLSISLFILRRGVSDRQEIDLGKSQFLRKVKLSDGETGYRSIGAMDRLTVYFSDENFVSKGLKIYIIDATGEGSTAKLMGQILEVLGGKVVSIDKKTKDENIDCQIKAKDKAVALKVGNIFHCDLEKSAPEFDLEIIIGEKFAKRF